MAGSTPERGLGAVFTPAPLAAAAERRLAELAPAGATLLDPACGDGALLEAGARSGHWGGLHGLEQHGASVSRASERLENAHIQCVDALEEDLRWPEGAWILANPPWVSYSGRQGQKRSRPGLEGAGWPSLHGAFLERIARHVAEEQTAAVVFLPASLIELESYGPVRARVERWATPEQVVHLGESAFPGVVEPAVQLLLVPGRSGSPSGSWSRSPSSERIRAAFQNHPRLPTRTFADPGVHSGNSAREIVRPVEETRYPLLAQGRDLAPYDLGPPSARLRTDLERTPERRFRIGSIEHYRSFPILLRQTANRPLAALHSPATYFRNSLLACRRVDGLDPAFVVAVLNSAPARAWHRARFSDARQKTFPQVKVGHLATQPFPIGKRDEDPDLHDGVVRQVRALNPKSPDFDRERGSIERRIEESFGLDSDTLALVRDLA